MLHKYLHRNPFVIPTKYIDFHFKEEATAAERLCNMLKVTASLAQPQREDALLACTFTTKPSSLSEERLWKDIHVPYHALPRMGLQFFPSNSEKASAMFLQ